MKELIKDKRIRIRSLICQILSGPNVLDISKPDSLVIEAMEILSSLAAHDIDGSVNGSRNKFEKNKRMDKRMVTTVFRNSN